MYAFPCIGPCGCLCAQGTRAQPFRSLDRLGQRDEWQRTCLACYARLLARSRWDAVRQVYASYVARVLACGLLKAYFRACASACTGPGVAATSGREMSFRGCTESDVTHAPFAFNFYRIVQLYSTVLRSESYRLRLDTAHSVFFAVSSFYVLAVECYRRVTSVYPA